MVALITSILVAAAMTAGIVWYARRRPEGTPLMWGEAMAAAIYVFFLSFLAFGIIPHQWLTLAENELSWRADRMVWGPANILRPQSQGGWFPFDVTYRTVSDSIGALFYVVFFGAFMKLWVDWQNRGKSAEKRAAVATSTYGRPLVKQG
ncbi:MAG: hypothetical protein ACK5RL_00110 [Acidimicrobiales bacterium]